MLKPAIIQSKNGILPTSFPPLIPKPKTNPYVNIDINGFNMFQIIPNLDSLISANNSYRAIEKVLNKLCIFSFITYFKLFIILICSIYIFCHLLFYYIFQVPIFIFYVLKHNIIIIR